MPNGIGGLSIVVIGIAYACGGMNVETLNSLVTGGEVMILIILSCHPGSKSFKPVNRKLRGHNLVS